MYVEITRSLEVNYA